GTMRRNSLSVDARKIEARPARPYSHMETRYRPVQASQPHSRSEHSNARDGRLRGEEQIRPPAPPGRARRGDRHHTARQGRGETRAGSTRLRPRKGPPGRRRHPRSQQGRHARRPEDQGPDQRRPAVSFVVDSSVALSWCFEDERTPATTAPLERIGETGAEAPQHWPAEVLNGLMMAERRQRIDAARRRQLAGFLSDLPI